MIELDNNLAGLSFLKNIKIINLYGNIVSKSIIVQVSF